MPKLTMGKIPEKIDFLSRTNITSMQGKLMPILIILSYMINEICPNSSWVCRLVLHLEKFPAMSDITLKEMGFESKLRDYFKGYSD
jgi:hypothetical protein